MEPGLPELSLDEGAIGQALGNLVDNAIKYSGERRWLRVAARRAGDAVAIDGGRRGGRDPAAEEPGDLREVLPRRPQRDPGPAGTGLGLALVKHVVEAHGGRVGVQSRPGEGSRFTLAPAGGADGVR